MVNPCVEAATGAAESTSGWTHNGVYKKCLALLPLINDFEEVAGTSDGVSMVTCLLGWQFVTFAFALSARLSFCAITILGGKKLASLLGSGFVDLFLVRK